MSRCSAAHCPVHVRPGRLFCHAHWALVSKPLQDTIWRLHNNGVLRDGYAEACENAVKQVNEKLARR